MKGPKWWDRLLGNKPPPQPNGQPEPEPAPSYFDRDNDKPDDKKPSRAKSSHAAPQTERPRADAEKRAPAQPGDAKAAFDKATDAAAVKEQQMFEQRFKTEADRETALEARETAQALKDQIEEKYQNKSDAMWRHMDRMLSDGRPAPQDATRDWNRDERGIRDWKKKEFDRIDQRLESVYARIARGEANKPVIFKRLQLETTYETSPTTDFNDVAGNPRPTASSEAAEGVAHARPAKPVIDYVAEFNKRAAPRPDGPGIRP